MSIFANKLALGAAALAVSLVAASCSSDSGEVSLEAAPEVPQASESTETTAESKSTVEASESTEDIEASETESTTGPEDETTTTQEASVTSAQGFDVELVNLSSGETTTLSSFVEGDKPVVLWGFAPHCGTCQSKVADYNSFVADNPDVTVIGVGQTDTLGLANDFYSSTNPEFPLVYATGGNVWDQANFGFQMVNVYSADLSQRAQQPFHFSNSTALESALSQLS